MGAHELVETRKAGGATAARAVGWRAYSNKKARKIISSRGVVGGIGKLRGRSKVKIKLARRPAGLNKVDSVDAPLAAEFQLVLPSHPAHCTSHMVGVLALAEDGKRLPSDTGSVITTR